MRLIGLDVIRCFAIILLLAAHIFQTIGSPLGMGFGIPNIYFVTIGGLAVTFFLFLSGAVLELNYGGKSLNYSEFLVKRLLRIYPIYYMSLFLGILVFSFISNRQSESFFANFSHLSYLDVIFSITGGYAFAGKWGGPFVKTSWFIALIIALYMLFPFLSYQIRRRPHSFIVLCFLVSLSSRLLIGHLELLPTRPLDWFPLCRIFEFSLGIYLVKIMPTMRFNQFEGSTLIRSVVVFLSEMSFPLFLVHYPLLFIIPELTKNGVNQVLAICIYISISLVMSWGLLAVDKTIPRSWFLQRFISQENQ